MKKCILTAYDINISKSADINILLQNKISYSKKYGWDFICKTDKDFDKTKHPVFSKIKFIVECLNYYDLVFWNDMDSVFTNFNIDVTDILKTDEYIGALEQEKNYFCAGNIMIESNEYTKNFFWSLHDLPSWQDESFPREQRCFNEKLALTNYKHIRRFKINEFGSFNGDGHWWCIRPWQTGDFMLHINAPKRSDGWNEIIKVFLKYKNLIIGNQLIKIIPVIINWKGQIEKTLHLHSIFKNIFNNKVYVINNDKTVLNEHEITSEWITIPDNHFYTKQFFKAIDIFLEEKGDFLFIALADGTSNNWKEFINSIPMLYEKYKFGVLTPHIDFSPWSNSLFKEHEKGIFSIKNSDGICLLIHKDIIKEFIKYKHAFISNNYGWGIDIVICALSWFYGKPVLQNRNCKVNHVKGSGYNEHAAMLEMNQSFSELPKYLSDYKDFVFYNNLDVSWLNIKISDLLYK